MIGRRRFLKLGIATAGGLYLSSKLGSLRSALAAPIPGGTLDPTTVPKYHSPMVIPPAMPRTSKLHNRGGKNGDYYEIGVRQFQQQILPAGCPPTTVWSYGSINHPWSFNYPAFTIEAKWKQPVRVKWINQLVDASGNYLPHLLPVDQTLHWANPPGGAHHRDMRTDDPSPYTGPVPIVTHVHGAHTFEESDGYPEAWYLPAAGNIPGGFAAVGSWYDAFNAEFQTRYGADAWEPGSAVFQYPNDQRATTLWYHDHTLGMTRLNVYAGPAGFYVLRGGPDDEVMDSRTGHSAILPGPAPSLGDSGGMIYYEFPIVIQDRSFNADGSLFFPASRDFFDGFTGPYIPDSDISPIWNPEFFGNTMVVNGVSWPYLNVEQRRYRFRLLNGCNSRFLILKFDSPHVRVWQIGAEGGFLPAPIDINAVSSGQILLALAERADIIVDFSDVPAGTAVTMLNLAPDEPFGGGVPGVDFDPSDPETTGQVMAFCVVPATSHDRSTPPERLVLPTVNPLVSTGTRQLSLNETDSEILADVGPRSALLGTLNSDGSPNPLEWMDEVTETPAVGATEVWEIHNFTMDAHPIHVHLVQFQVVGREAFGGGPSISGSNSPQPWETGFKDTVIAYPDEITRIRAHFDRPGLFVWHCHIIDHEDNEMMRPYRIVE